MRPGETIRRNANDTCDASNTAFGKPPICVLRLGDMYNTKIIINNLNISYDPLVWDLNPEGIGVQPMIANVNMSIKYIGGSGLRTYVDELQNALSFNYYANADIYDGRTYANTNESERALINQERSFFDGNQLDLIPIISAGERYVQDKYNETLPGGTIGSMSLVNQPTPPGGIYSDFINNSTLYNSGVIYQTYDVVFYENNFYLRQADNNATYGISGNTLSNKIPTNTTYWQKIDWRNYGEQGFLFEYIGSTDIVNTAPPTDNDSDEYLSKRYFNTYEVEYYDVFKDFYNTYAKLVVGNFNYNKLHNKTDILRLLLLNKNYNTYIADQNSIDQFNTLKTQTTGITNTVANLINGVNDDKFYLYRAFDIEAESRNYKDFGSIGNLMSRSFGIMFEPQPLKLHLYPQEYLYKIGNGSDIVRGFYGDTDRYNPGKLTQTNEAGGLYIKDYSYYGENIDGLFLALKNELKAKLKLELSHFWFKTPESLNTYKNYLRYFESPHRKVFTDYLVNKLENYYADISENMRNTVTDLTTNTGKLATLLSGLSVITDGYDVRLDNDTQKRFYEVIPNGVELTTPASIIFGYEPYNEYKTSSLNNHEIINFSDCSNYTFLATEPTVTNENKVKFLSMGNGNYLFKQISSNERIQDIAGTGYTFNNLMVQSSALNDAVAVTGTTQNFVLYSGVTGYSGITINSVQDYSAQLTADGTTVKTLTDADGTYNNFYDLKYTFEKINYELFDFSNKTIDIMLNDNFINQNFDLDISINQANGFMAQVTGLTSDATNLFYYSDKIDYKTTDINYYTYMVPTSSTIYNTVSSINNFLIYDIPITAELEDSRQQLVGPTPESSVLGENIHMSGLLDLIFLDFFFSIGNTDKEEIMNSIKKAENKPVRGISLDPKTSAKQLTDRYNKISNTLDGIFTSIFNYRSSASDKLTLLADAYTSNYDAVKLGTNNVFTTESTWKDMTTDLITPTLIKGGEKDYTLSMRDTRNIKESAKNNYTLFINNRNMFNIINTNENKQTIIGPTPDTGTTQTELSKYEIGQ
jgi:RNAse (barnase) inhibitor barstar